MQGANRSHSRSYCEDLQRRGPPEARMRGDARHLFKVAFNAPAFHPRPMKGILVAISVMNCTLASSGSEAI
jgi:hypothetical protein